MFGLDHSIIPLDPMTWLSPPVEKPAFQDVDSDCGETEARPCHCNLAAQNSYRQLMATLGDAQRLR
jgi:hypothetical protein